MKKKSQDTTKNSSMTDEMRLRILKYAEAYNKGDHASAEAILHEINQNK